MTTLCRKIRLKTKHCLHLHNYYIKNDFKNMNKNRNTKINQTVNSKIMEGKVFKTACQEEREAKDMAVYNEWNELMKVPGQSASGVAAHLMQKYNIHSQSTIWVIRKRVERKMKKEGK